MIEIKQSSNYIFDPLKRSFVPTVRITALVFMAVNKWKKILILSKLKAGKASKSDLLKVNFPPAKFQMFSCDGNPEKGNKSKS